MFTGPLTGNRLATAYASSDVFLFPSDTETFGNVTLEAMASGLPAVCADAAGSDLLVVDGKTGYLAPPRDSARFLTHVTGLIERSELRTRMGAAARTRALTFEWEQIMACLAAYYAEIWQQRAEPEGDGFAGPEPAVRLSVSRAVA